MSEKYETDFDFFWKKINNGDNFSFVRYADGEVMLIKGIPVGTGTQAYQIDKWSSSNNTLAGSDLLEGLKIYDDNYYFAISSKSDNISDYEFLVNNINNTNNLTIANLWINANYSKNLEKIKSLEREVVLICNEKCHLDKIPFKVKEFLPFYDDCVNFWETNKSDYSEKLKNISSKYKNTLFVVCCGPLSAVIINIMFNTNYNNTYIDFGSSLDIFIHNKTTRPYMDEDSQYHNHISKF